jgi:phosphoribosyl 1,2-cyclic phosphodiesterase
MRVAMLGSGSKGNATLVEAGGTRVLIDCGFAVREVEARAERLGFDLASLDAILVTHEHGDHIGGVARLSRSYGLPVYLTRGTHSAWRDPAVAVAEMISPHQPFRIGALEIEPLAVPHDAREPCQFVFRHGGKTLGVVSDLGSVTPYLRTALADCDALLLEFNHDEAMLHNGPYPQSLKTRVGGGWGHLSNRQAGQLLAGLDARRLQHLVLTHLSEQNNTPALALAAAHTALQGAPDWCVCADQGLGLSWRTVA